MKYIEKTNLIDTEINLKKIIDETYRKGYEYYKNVEKAQHEDSNQDG